MSANRSRHQDTFKRKSTSVDKRTLRHHKRSEEWKKMRSATLNQRRNIGEVSATLSPVIEKSKTKALTRKEMLDKWKKEKSLKKIQTEREGNKKQTFRVLHVKQEAVPFSQPFAPLPKPKPEKKIATTAAPTRVTRASAARAGASSKPPGSISKKDPSAPSPFGGKKATSEYVKFQGTRKNVKLKPPPALELKEGAPKRVTRSSKSARDQPPATSVPSSRKARPAVEPAATKSLTSRQAARQTSLHQATRGKVKAARAGINSEKEASTVAPSPHVTTSRGDASFAPAGFQFTAPAALKVSFQPLSPGSAASFLFPGHPLNDRRCSTPKDKNQSGKVIETPAVSIVREIISEGSSSGSEKEGGPVACLWRDTSNKRRPSTSSACAAQQDAGCSANTDTDRSKEAVRRPRRSRRSAAVHIMEWEVEADGTGIEAEAPGTKDRSRRKSRRSVAPRKDAGAAAAEAEVAHGSTENESLSPAQEKNPTKSVLETENSTAMEVTESVTCMPSVVRKGRRKSRRSFATPGRKDAGRKQEELQDAASPEIPLAGEVKPALSEPLHTSADAGKKNVELTSGAGETQVLCSIPDRVAFATPSTPPSVARSRARAHSMVVSSTGKKMTPRNLRNSLILRALSPEEGVEVLKNSPMVEMRRKKTPKTPRSMPMIPLPDFSDVDEILASGISSDDTHISTSYCGESSNGGLVSGGTITPLVSDTLNTPRVEGMDTRETAGMDGPTPASKQTQAEAVTGEVNLTTAVTGESDEHDVPYFRRLVTSETARLNALCDNWTEKNKALGLPEEVCGQIRTSVGCAQLLIAQRFKQFSGLVDNCEFNTGEKAIHCSDLQGFWDMVYYQVEDVDKKFEELGKLEAGGWKVEKPKPLAKKKIIKKKPAATSAKPTAKSKFAEFRARMKQQQQASNVEKEPSTTEGSAKEAPVSPTTFDPSEAACLKVERPVNKSLRMQRSGRSRRSQSPAIGPVLGTVLSQSASVACGASANPATLSVPGSPASALKRKVTEDTSSLQSKRMKSLLDSDVGSATRGTPTSDVKTIASSISTPDTGTPGTGRTTRSVRRSMRLSTRSMASSDLDCNVDQPTKQSDDVFLKYLMPSAEPVHKDGWPARRRSVHQGLQTPLSKARHLSQSASGRRRSRRSVQPQFNSPALHRTLVSAAHHNQENLSASEASTPSTLLSKLSMDGTPQDTVHKPAASLLFTPFNNTPKTLVRAEGDLMVFSPISDN